MLALAEVEADECGGCGYALEKTLSTEPEDWTIPPPQRCAVCTRIAIEQGEFSDQGTKHLHALRWAAVRRLRR